VRFVPAPRNIVVALLVASLNPCDPGLAAADAQYVRRVVDETVSRSLASASPMIARQATILDALAK